MQADSAKYISFCLQVGRSYFLRSVCYSFFFKHAVAYGNTLPLLASQFTTALTFENIHELPNTLHIRQHTATHGNTLHYAATHCNTLQHTASHCNTLQHTATHGITLQHTATHCNTTSNTYVVVFPATHHNTLQHTATHCNTLQHTATHCNTLQHSFQRLCGGISGRCTHWHCCWVCNALYRIGSYRYSISIGTYLLLYNTATHCCWVCNALHRIGSYRYSMSTGTSLIQLYTTATHYNRIFLYT